MTSARLLLPFLPLLMSFAFTPMSQTMEAGQKQVQYLLDNPSGEPMAVEIALRERIQKEDGSEDNPPTKQLAAFPPQLIIPPKEKRAVRVSWVGPALAQGTAEKSFRVVAEQLPLNVDGKKQKGSGIKMLLKYVAALYVNPGSTSPEVQVVKLEPGKELKVTVENRGTEHAPLTNPTLTLTKGSQKIVLKDGAVKGLAGENILAGARRVFTLPAVPAVTPDFKGTLKID